MGFLTDQLGKKLTPQTIERRGHMFPVSFGFLEYYPAYPELGVPVRIQGREITGELIRLKDFVKAREVVLRYLEGNQEYRDFPAANREIISFSPKRLVARISYPSNNEVFEMLIHLVNDSLEVYFSGESMRQKGGNEFMPYLFYVSNAIRAYIESGFYREA